MLYSRYFYGILRLEAGPITHRLGHDHFDAVTALCVFWVPIFPLSAEHHQTPTLRPFRLFVHGLEGVEYPLRLAPRILVKAYVRRVAWLLVTAAGVLFIMGANRGSGASDLYLLGLGAASLAVLLFLVVHQVNRREARIRNVLGVHGSGMSDPFTWPGGYPLNVKRTTLEETGLGSLEYVIEQRLTEGDLPGALSLARSFARTDDRLRGEEFTNRILEAAERKGQAD